MGLAVTALVIVSEGTVVGLKVNEAVGVEVSDVGCEDGCTLG